MNRSLSQRPSNDAKKRIKKAAKNLDELLRRIGPYTHKPEIQDAPRRSNWTNSIISPQEQKETEQNA